MGEEHPGSLDGQALVKWVTATSANELQVEVRLPTHLEGRGSGSAAISVTAANHQNDSERTAKPAADSQLFTTFPEETTLGQSGLPQQQDRMQVALRRTSQKMIDHRNKLLGSREGDKHAKWLTRDCDDNYPS